MARKEARRNRQQVRSWRSRLGWFVGALVVLALCVAIRRTWGPQPAQAQAPVEQTKTADKQAEVMATVSGHAIRRQGLANACLERFGAEVLESLVNKHLIAQYCKQRKIVITRGDVDREIETLAKKFNLGIEQYLKLLERERGINPEQYARDIIWPTLALRRLAIDRLEVRDEELREAYESEFGPAVKARLIAVDNVALAKRLRAQAVQRPKEFPKLALDHSKDINSASLGGLLQPIRRHMGDDQIEQVVFNLAEGEVSPVLRVGEQFVLLKCEGHLPPSKVSLARVRPRLEEKIKQKKLRAASNEIFAQLQKSAVIQNVYNDPQLRRQMPGIAATINGHRIFTRDLAEECLARYGEEVLEGEINKVLLSQELKRRRVEVTQADIQAEIGHAATLAGVVAPSGKPDLPKWIEIVTKKQNTTEETYIRDVVWPSAALKKLVQGQVKITSQDLQKGFEANYGARVRCRAIVISNLRRAQEVWNKAREYDGNDLTSYFGQLAEQYSEEASSRALQGQVPPIRRFGGQPLLEKEAFQLKPGEISGVIQVGPRFVVLYCESWTQAMKVEMAEVRDMIERDIREKKTRLAMSEHFEKLQASARIDNYLAGTSSGPKKRAGSRSANPGTRRERG